jgi:uncharacterized protein (UPF0335 family)
MTDLSQISVYIEKIEKLIEDKKDLQAEINAVYKEAKTKGYEKKPLKAVIAKRRQETEKRLEEEFLIEKYSEAVGLKTGEN